MSHLTPEELERITSYVSDALSPEECVETENWITADQNRYAMARALKKMRVALGNLQEAHFQTDALVDDVRQAIGKAPSKEFLAQEAPGDGAGIRFVSKVPNLLQVGTGSVGLRILREWVWSLGIVVTLAAMFFVFRTGFSRAPGTVRRYATGAYQQGILTLDDGTRVTLAPETMLQLVDFGMRHRTVIVDGKAYFEVSNTKGVPFEVRTGSVTTQVLGTAFLVDYGRHSSHVRVAVEEGKVRVKSASRTDAAVIITAGNVGEITNSSVTVNAVADTGSSAEWLQGQLFFHHATVATVLQTLSRWYGYRFQYADSSLSQRQVTISLSVRSPASALATLEQVLRVNLTMTGDTVTLTPKSERSGKGWPKVHSYEVWTPTREVGR